MSLNLKPGEPTAPAAERSSWHTDSTMPSLPEVHRTVTVPKHLGFWRKLLAFSGPGYLVAVGYMDPGNWATDLEGGARFGYTLLSVILLSNLMAILLQSLSAKLGIVTGRDLAQACRDHYSRPVSFVLWLLCEVAICACDLAEVIGSAIALNLLFKIPLLWGVCLTSLDVLAVMYLQSRGFRWIEALVITLILTIGGCFFLEIIFSHPSLPGILNGFLPTAEIVRDPLEELRNAFAFGRRFDDLQVADEARADVALRFMDLDVATRFGERDGRGESRWPRPCNAYRMFRLHLRHLIVLIPT